MAFGRSGNDEGVERAAGAGSESGSSSDESAEERLRNAKDETRQQVSGGSGSGSDDSDRGSNRDSGSDDDDDRDSSSSGGRDYPNPIAGDPPARGSAADDNDTGPDDEPDGRNLGSSVSDEDRRRAQAQRRAEDRVDQLDPTDPESPGGTTVGSRETERYLRAASAAGVTLRDVDENGALAAQIERQSDVDPRELSAERDDANVDYDPAEGEFRITRDAPQSSRRRRRDEGLTQSQARNAAEGLGGPGSRAGEPPSSTSNPQGATGQVTVAEARNAVEGIGGPGSRSGGGGGGVPVNMSTPNSLIEQTERRRVNQDQVSQLVSQFESVTGFDVPGDGRATTPTNPDRDQLGDFEGGALGALDDATSAFAEAGQDAVDRVFSQQNRQSAENLDRVPQIPGAPVLTVGGLGSGQSGQFVEGTARGATSIVTETPNTVVEASEFAAEAVEETAAGRGEAFAERTGEVAVNRAVQTGEAAATNPAQFAGALAGSTVVSAGAIGTAARVGGPRTAKAVSTAIQPGEEAAIAAARAGAISPKLAARVPGVSRSQVGETTSGTSGTRTPRLRDRARALSERSPDVTVRRDADAPLLEIDPLLRQQVRDRAQDLTNAAQQRAQAPTALTNPRDTVALASARFRRGVSEARRDARAEFRQRVPSRPDVDLGAALRNPTDTAALASARTQRALSDTQAETRRRISALGPDGDGPSIGPVLRNPGDAVRLGVARTRRGVEEFERDVRAETRRRVSEARPDGDLSLSVRDRLPDGPDASVPASLSNPGDAARLTSARFRRGVSEARRDVRAETRREVSEATELGGLEDTLSLSTARARRSLDESTPSANRIRVGLAEEARAAREQLRGIGAGVGSGLRTPSLSTPDFPSPGDLTISVGPARPRRQYRVPESDSPSIGYDLEADGANPFGDSDADTPLGDASNAGQTGGADAFRVGQTADSGRQQLRFRRRDERATEAGDDLREQRRSSPAQRRAEAQGTIGEVGASQPAVTAPDVTTGVDIGGRFEGDAATGPSLSTDIEPGVRTGPRSRSRTRDRQRTDIEPGREFRPETNQETRPEIGTELQTEPETRPEQRREIAVRLEPSRRERRGDIGLRGGVEREQFTSSGDGDEGRFVYETRSLL